MTTDPGNAASLQASMAALDEHFNGEKPKGLAPGDHSWRRWGLAILQFKFGTNDGIANYVSNGADRADMIPFLRETADRFENALQVEQDEVMGRINEADIMGMVGSVAEKAGGIPKTDAVAKKLTDEGKIIEAGWVGYKKMAYKPTTPPARLTEARVAFIAGAAHLFSSMMEIMDPGREEPTEADFRRMDQIEKELRGFIEQRFGKRPGKR